MNKNKLIHSVIGVNFDDLLEATSSGLFRDTYFIAIMSN